MSLLSLDERPHISNLNDVFCLPADSKEGVGEEGMVLKMGTVKDGKRSELQEGQRAIKEVLLGIGSAVADVHI